MLERKYAIRIFSQGNKRYGTIDCVLATDAIQIPDIQTRQASMEVKTTPDNTTIDKDATNDGGKHRKDWKRWRGL